MTKLIYIKKSSCGSGFISIYVTFVCIYQIGIHLKTMVGESCFAPTLLQQVRSLFQIINNKFNYTSPNIGLST